MNQTNLIQKMNGSQAYLAKIKFVKTFVYKELFVIRANALQTVITLIAQKASLVKEECAYLLLITRLNVS